MTWSEVIMSSRDITKTYGVTEALKGVDFDIRTGKVTVLFGENGAGKSTLMKILSGVEQPTSGELILRGEPVEFVDTNDAVDHGIAIIHQELNLAPNLTVRDNIFLGREIMNSRGVDFRAEEEKVREVMARLEEDISPTTLVADLRLGQQQLVEIARAISLNAEVLIMDEPTSALSSTEVEVLFRVIDELTAQGVAIVYISHHLEEALEVSDYCVVFRDGNLVATESSENVDLDWVITKMIGGEVIVTNPTTATLSGKPMLEVANYSVADQTNPNRLSVDSLELTVHAGEIVCLFGLMGAGRTELLESLAGRIPPVTGEVYVDGRLASNKTIAQRIDAGMALVPEDRQRDGLVQTMSVGQNISLAHLAQMLRGMFIRFKMEAEKVLSHIGDVRVKTSGPKAPIGSLSGGNQQKVVIGKILMTEPQVILLDEPTRGIDVGAKSEVFSLLQRQSQEGMAVLFATSEIGEALSAAHRVVVMRRGRIVAERLAADTDRAELMALASEESETVMGESL